MLDRIWKFFVFLCAGVWLLGFGALFLFVFIPYVFETLLIGG